MPKYGFYIPRVHVSATDFLEDATSFHSRLLFVWYAIVNLLFNNQEVVSKPHAAGRNSVEFFTKYLDQEKHVRIVAHLDAQSHVVLSRYENGTLRQSGILSRKDENENHS